MKGFFTRMDSYMFLNFMWSLHYNSAKWTSKFLITKFDGLCLQQIKKKIDRNLLNLKILSNLISNKPHWGEPLHKSSIQYNSKILWLKWFIYATNSKKLKKSGKCSVQIRNSGNPEIRIRFPEKNLTQNFHKIRF